MLGCFYLDKPDWIPLAVTCIEGSLKLLGRGASPAKPDGVPCSLSRIR